MSDGGNVIPQTVPASDPNLDLIGYEFDGPDHARWVVVGTTSWSTQYVHTRTVDGVTKESCANAKLLRESR